MLPSKSVFALLLLLEFFHPSNLQREECVNNKIRLAQGNDTSEGRVEVCTFSRWATVCGIGWDDLDAQVVCRQLGYPSEGAVARMVAFFGEGTGRIALGNSSCLGTEDSLQSCNAVQFPSYCNHAQDVGVSCPQRICDTYDLRLSDEYLGSYPYRGQLEICISGTWRRICSLNFTIANAAVSCRELGYSTLGSLNASFTSNITSNRVSFACQGSETKLGLCTPILQDDLCSMHRPYEDAGVFCDGNCYDGDVRLVGGYTDMEGRVELCFFGVWGTVCDDLWDDTDALVVCNQIGNFSSSPGSAVAVTGTYSAGSGPIHLSNVQCTGSEVVLLMCSHQQDNNCFHSEDAGVSCIGAVSSCADDEIRLFSMEDPRVGRVQVCINRVWVQVCVDGWMEEESQVACRQLGYSGRGAEFFDGIMVSNVVGISMTSGSGSGGSGSGGSGGGGGIGGESGSGNGCGGHESNFGDCMVDFTSTCGSFISAGLRCQALCHSGEIRLVGGRDNLEGRVEVCADGRWGSVCDDGWGVDEATVVCRQLGLNTTGSLAFRNGAFGEGSVPVLVSNMNCTGNETRLDLCDGEHSPICSHSEDAGVKCSCYENSIRLINGSSPLNGRVEVCMHGTFGTVCGDFFDISDANVICRQLGYGAPDFIFAGAFFGQGFGFIWIDNLFCDGTEMSLSDCRYNSHTSDCRHLEDISVGCQGPLCRENDLRLFSSGSGPLEGRVEICIQQVWSSVCDYLWDNTDARVVCQQLGYSPIGAVALRNSYYGSGTGPIVLDGVHCSGTERNLLSCPSHPNPTLCTNDNEAGVQCQALCTEKKVRLTGGTNATNGRVEVCLQGQYRTICNDGWDDNDAAVVCKQIHQSISGSRAFSYGNAIVQPYRTNFQCNGNELTLVSCNNASPPFVCMSGMEAGASCLAGCISGDLRKVQINHFAPQYFLVELCVNGVWNRVCASSWTMSEWDVVCREMGFYQAVGDYFPALAANPRPPYVDGFQCTGSESALAQCSYNITSSSCSRQAGVQCSATRCTEGLIRLVNYTSSLYEGRVEICTNGTWGTICDDLWDDNDAQIVCSSLGLSRLGAIAFGGGHFPAGTGPIKFSDTICTGSEMSLQNCSIRVDHTCTHVEDAGVRCRGICTPGNPGINELNCENGGYCALVNQNQSSYFCQCLPGFTGSRCEVDIDNYCLNIECRNGGMCMEGYGENVSCVCEAGFTGEFCELCVDVCLQDTCKNGGSCSDRPISGVICSCQPGFIGEYCETELCMPETCMNGGTCIVADGSCTCPIGFSGQRCEENNFCVSQPCMYGGTCDKDHNICICNLGYEGIDCGIDTDNCPNTVCENGGMCVEEIGIQTSCTCTSNYGGPRCTIPVVDRNAPCPAEPDDMWNLQYPQTQQGNSVSHPCSAILPLGSSMIVSGESTRLCGDGGIWGSVDVSSCRREDIVAIEQMANNLFSQEEIQAEDVDNLVEELANATNPQGISQFPRDLEATTSIIDRTVLYLQDDLSSLTPSQLRTRIVAVISNTLEEENIIGWNGISLGNVGSESLLRSAEIYGNYFAVALSSDNVNKSSDITESKGIVENNIEVRAAIINQSNIEDVLFPTENSAENNKNFGSAQSRVPSSYLVNKGAENSEVNVVNILFNNLEQILPRHSISATQQPATSVISVQVIGNITESVGFQDAAVTFRFTTRIFGSDKEVSNATCVFFRFEENLASSSWSTENVVTTEVRPIGNNSFVVTCESKHLTSFSVLVDVNNADISDLDRTVLNYITYIGLGISIFCLLITILFFTCVIRKELFNSVHYFIHLNLSIALLLGYVAFLAGIDTAVVNRIACAFVAGILHYLFTAVFCWMLCEGIMLYLMLVVVFSELSKKWWFFMLLGWGPPLIIVGVSAAIIHRQYGTEDYCWISAEDPKQGAIWAFALPMLVVIIINVGFLIAALVALYRVRKDRRKKLHIGKTAGAKESTELFRQLFLATVVLLPLLGLTWVFGLLSVNRSTVVFAYIFTILNSLQGFFIFVFHVIRSDKVWGRFCGKKSRRPKSSKSSGGTSRFGTATRTSYMSSSKSTLRRSSTISNSFSEAMEMSQDTRKLINKEDNIHSASHIKEVEVEDKDFSYTINATEKEQDNTKTHI